MATILGIAMQISANTAGISKGARDTAKKIDDIQQSAKQAASAMKAMVGIKVAEILASGFSSASSAISGFVSDIRSTIDATAKLAARTGVAVEAMQGFQVAAGLSGVSNLDGAIQKLTIVVGDAASGVKTAQDAFAKLGLSYDDLAKMSPEDQFRAIAAEISKLPTQAERAAAAVDIFGKSGVELLPMFEANLQAIEERAKRLGIVLSGDQTAAIEEMNDALSLVYQTFQGIIGQVTANLAPVVTSLAEEFLGFVEGYQGLGEGTGGTALADSITTALFDGAEYLAGILDFAVESFMSFGATMETVSAVFDFAANVFTAVAETLRGIFNVFEMIGNALLMGLGKILEGIGSWVSSDLEQAGKDIANSAYEGMKKNGAEAGGAFVNAVNAGLGDRNYGKDGGGGGTGMFSSAVSGARGRFDNRAQTAAEREQKRAAQLEEQRKANEAMQEKKRQEERERQEKEAAKKREEYEEKLADMRADLASKEFQYAAKNAADLAKVNQQALKVSDIRSGGIDQYIALATGREDPAVEASRQQLRELQAMRMSLDGLAMIPVEIAGAA